MRFKVDENLPTEAAEALRAAGHDAPTVLDQGAGGMPDADLATLVKQEQRALLTFDQGFGDIRSHPPEEYSGLVVLRLKRQDKVHLLSVMPKLIAALASEPQVVVCRSTLANTKASSWSCAWSNRTTDALLIPWRG